MLKTWGAESALQARAIFGHVPGLFLQHGVLWCVRAAAGAV